MLDASARFFQRDRATLSVASVTDAKASCSDVAVLALDAESLTSRCNFKSSGSGALSVRVRRCLPPRVSVEATRTIAAPAALERCHLSHRVAPA
jgi:hypothetical protein